MECQKIVNLLDTTSDEKDLPRFATKKWIEVYDQSTGVNYNAIKEIRIKNPVLRSDLCDYSDTYIVVKRIYCCYRTKQCKKKQERCI